MDSNSLKIVMFPWFALGHLTPFLRLSNKLANNGHRVSFFVPRKTESKLEHLNLYPELITFVPINVPHVPGLPPGAETSSDVPFSLAPLVMTAMDRTESDVELLLQDIKPDIIFFDFTHWIPTLARKLGIKSVHYCTTSPAMIGYTLARQRRGGDLSEADLMQPPPGYPDSSIKLYAHEARAFVERRRWKFGSDILWYERLTISFTECDAIGLRSCRETEGPFADYLHSQFAKPVLLSGPAIPDPPTSTLKEKWTNWLGKFKAGSVIYCALGSECILRKDQFQELLLGFELSGLPFLAALKPPSGADTVENALPDGFEERVEGRGVVHGEWVRQQLLLEHPSIGCFVTHCGYGSLSEALVNRCQMVLLPHMGDQIINARLMSGILKVGVEVEKGEEDGLFTRESVCKAIRTVMEAENEIGKEVRDNHAKLRDLLLREDLESSYIESFCKSLRDLVG